MPESHIPNRPNDWSVGFSILFCSSAAGSSSCCKEASNLYSLPVARRKGVSPLSLSLHNNVLLLLLLQRKSNTPYTHAYSARYTTIRTTYKTIWSYFFLALSYLARTSSLYLIMFLRFSFYFSCHSLFYFTYPVFDHHQRCLRTVHAFFLLFSPLINLRPCNATQKQTIK